MEIENKTRRRPRAHPRQAIDVQRIAEALKGKGIDTRTWLKSATVGVWTDGGQFVTTDPDGIYADRLGAVVDVRIEPEGLYGTARWNGVGVGQFGSILYPIRPGEEVVVGIPDGELGSDLIILASQSNRVAQIPADWQNDRVLFDMRVPFEIRGPNVFITSPILSLNGRLVNRGADPI